MESSKKSSFSVFEGSELFNLSNVTGGARITMSRSKGSSNGATDTADETPSSSGSPSGSGQSTGGKWDNVKWKSDH